MSFDTVTKPLLRVALFQGLQPLQITEIGRRADRVLYRPGDLIIEAGTDGGAAVLIVAGDAVRVAGPTPDLYPEPIPAGSLVGEMGMLIETEYLSTVVARGPVRALRIRRTDLQEQMKSDPALADHFVNKIAARLSRFATELRKIDSAFSQYNGITVGPNTAVFAHH